MRRLNSFFLTLAGLLTSSASFALAPLDRSELQAACNAYPASPTGSLCVLCIQGFPDGTPDAEYCAGDPVPEQLNPTDADTTWSAPEVVYAVLRWHFLREG